MHRMAPLLFPQPFDSRVHGTYPAGLETAPSARDAADIDIVIVLPVDEAKARASASQSKIPVRGLYVARR